MSCEADQQSGSPSASTAENGGFAIGGLSVANPFVLAPLAGYTDLPFRLLCRRFGAGLVFSEMISCHGLVYRQQKTLEMISTIPEERPVVMQLFGSDAPMMGRAAAMLSAEPIDVIDINMGCPVKKVVKKGAGAALMKDPQLAEEIIRAVCRKSSKPVTVKIRSGWNHQEITAPEFAAMAQEAGASAVTVHARTWSDGFSGRPDWEVIARTKEAVSIPVIGNGDILSREDGLAMMAGTGCDAVMIGRGALGRPWVFKTGEESASLAFRLEALSLHLDYIASHCLADRVLAKTKNHAGRYFKGLPHGAALRSRIYRATSFAELRALVDSLATSR